MNLQGTGESLTREIIAGLEEKWDVFLPEDYVAFMLRNNGGTPEEDWLFDFVDPVTENNNASIIRDFYKIYTASVKSYDDLERICNIMWEEQLIGKDMLPIADDPGGNPICMCVSKENYGKIYFCDHESEDADTGYLLMSEIAPSFSAFLDQLYLYGEG